LTVFSQPVAGSPDDSVAFYRDHKSLIGEVVDAHVYTPDPARKFGALLRDVRGNYIALTGVWAGGRSAPSTAALAILRDAGFSLRSSRQVLRGDAWLHKPLDEAVALRAGLPWAIRDPWHYRLVHSNPLARRMHGLGR
jgi:hypothetical protein